MLPALIVECFRAMRNYALTMAITFPFERPVLGSERASITSRYFPWPKVATNNRGAANGAAIRQPPSRLRMLGEARGPGCRLHRAAQARPANDCQWRNRRNFLSERAAERPLNAALLGAEREVIP